MAGFFAGPGAVNAALVYQVAQVYDGSGKPLPGPVAGAVTFNRNP
jgi:hypothetical protein